MTEVITGFFSSIADLFDPTTESTSVAAALVAVFAIPVGAVFVRKGISIFKTFTKS